MGEKRFIFHSSCFLFIPSLGDKGRFPGQNTNQPFPLPTPTPGSLGGLLLLGTPSIPGTPGDTNTYLCTLGIISLHSYFWGPYPYPRKSLLMTSTPTLTRVQVLLGTLPISQRKPTYAKYSYAHPSTATTRDSS